MAVINDDSLILHMEMPLRGNYKPNIMNYPPNFVVKDDQYNTTISENLYDVYKFTCNKEHRKIIKCDFENKKYSYNLRVELSDYILSRDNDIQKIGYEDLKLEYIPYENTDCYINDVRMIKVKDYIKFILLLLKKFDKYEDIYEKFNNINYIEKHLKKTHQYFKNDYCNMRKKFRGEIIFKSAYARIKNKKKDSIMENLSKEIQNDINSMIPNYFNNLLQNKKINKNSFIDIDHCHVFHKKDKNGEYYEIDLPYNYEYVTFNVDTQTENIANKIKIYENYQINLVNFDDKKNGYTLKSKKSSNSNLEMMLKNQPNYESAVDTKKNFNE